MTMILNLYNTKYSETSPSRHLFITGSSVAPPYKVNFSKTDTSIK